MRPTLQSGDYVLVDPSAFRVDHPSPGMVVAAWHPYRSQVIIKRVLDVVDGQVFLMGDQPDQSTDSRSFGRIAMGKLVGQVKSRITHHKK